MISVQDVTIAYKGKKVLNSISLDIPKGEIHILLGLSGSGKSTLLKGIMGLTKLNSGKIQVNDRLLKPDAGALWRQSFGYVPQDGGLFPHLTVKDNVTLVARHLKWPLAKIEERLEQIKPLFNLKTSLYEKLPKQLSGGQKQRFSMMRALFLNPEVLVFDEPLGALDPITRHYMQMELKDLFESLEKTVLFVTHDLKEAERLGHRLSVIRAGEILQTDTFEYMVENPADSFISDFINSYKG